MMSNGSQNPCWNSWFAVCVVIGSMLLTGSGEASGVGCPTVIEVPQQAATIADAVAQACSGVPLEIVLSPGVWPMAIDTVTAGYEITIRGTSKTKSIVTGVSGQPLNTQYAADVFLEHLTLADVLAGSSSFNIHFDDCNVRDCVGDFVLEYPGFIARESRFERCSASGSYGFLYFRENNAVTNCQFIDCVRPVIGWTATASPAFVTGCSFVGCIGDAVQVRGAMNIVDCTFDQTNGSAIVAPVTCCTQGTRVNVTGCSFANGSSEMGAAVRDQSSTALENTWTFSTCAFSKNTAQAGGALYFNMEAHVTLSGCTFTNNVATVGKGGAFEREFGGQKKGLLEVTGCTFTSNSAVGEGGALSVSGWDGQLAVTDSTFTGNTSNTGGGAIRMDRQVASITDCNFVNNRCPSTGSGGAISQFIGSMNLVRCSFVSNAAYRGGAIWSYYDTHNSWTDCDFRLNHAEHVGGGVAIEQNSQVAFSGCLFDSNSADVGGGGVAYLGLQFQAPFEAVNSTFASNTAPEGPAIRSYAKSAMGIEGVQVCGSGTNPMVGIFTFGQGNCISESCSDIDNNGTPDECQVVTVPGSYKTIQAAIDTTPIGEYRIVSVGAGTFSGPIHFDGRSVVVRGAGAENTIIQGTSGVTASVVRFDGEPASAAIEGVTIRGGITGSPFPINPQYNIGGGIFSFNSAASIRNCVIEDNISVCGGGVYVWNGTGSITNCTIRNNDAGADGGGVQFFGGALRVVDTRIEGNFTNSRGGGMHIVQGNPVLVRTTVENNISANLVGGISWVPAGSAGAFLTMDDCDVTTNIAGIAQGGIGVLADGSLGRFSLVSTTACGNLPRANITGVWTDLGGNTVCDCAGDLTLDGITNSADLGIVLAAWGPCATGCSADINHDGIVDGNDLALLITSWGACGS